MTRFARPTELCATCSFANEHGSWAEHIPGLTHCRRCHATWPMRSEFQHCLGCHRTFTNWRACNAHKGPDGCRHPATVRDRHGRNRLAVSTRKLRPGSTITLWAMADHRGQEITPSQTAAS